MDLFGLNRNLKPSKFSITDEDRGWVEDSFRWLIDVFGYPKREYEQLLLSAEFFPQTFKAPAVQADNLIADLSCHLGLDPERIKCEFHEDLRDAYGVPYEVNERAFDSATELHDGIYTIHVAKSHLQQPERLVHLFICEFIHIRLTESGVEYDSEDTAVFIYVAAIYFGFGVILSQSLMDSGRRSDGVWETSWNFVAPIPYPVMAFALATYAKLVEQDNPAWKKRLTSSFREQFVQAMDHLDRFPSTVFNKAALSANDLFSQAGREYANRQYEEAISTLQKILFLTNDDLLKASVYNNMGYYQLRLCAFEKSTHNFLKAIEICPDFGFAHDNLGYALIRTGQPEEGRRSLAKALSTGNNDPGYSCRNLALYHVAKGAYSQAEDCFRQAFALGTSVDMLEFHYAELKFRRGDTDEGMEFLRRAAEKGEPEAENLLVEMQRLNPGG